MIQQLKVANFRGLASFEVRGLAPITVITGANGSGKTSILEALLLLQAGGNPLPLVNLQSQRGITLTPNLESVATGLFGSYKSIGQATIEGLEDEARSSLTIERVSDQKATTVVPLSGPQANGGLTDSSMLRFRWQRGEERRDFAFRVRFASDGVQLEIDNPIQDSGGRALLMHPTGKAAAEEEKKRFGDVKLDRRLTSVLQALRKFNDRIQDVEYLETTSGSFFAADLGDQTAPLGSLGGGINRLFQLLVGMESVAGGLLAIDEAEVSFHFSRLPDVVRALFEAARITKTQLVMTSHSREFLQAIGQVAQESTDSDLAIVAVQRKGNSVMPFVYSHGQALDSLAAGYEVR